MNIIPIPDPRLVPRYLLEQIKDREWEVNDWYVYQMQLVAEPTNVLLGFINDENKIVGIAWLNVDNFSKWIFINSFSVDPKYQQKKKLINQLKRYILKEAEKLKINTIMWAARRHKALEKYGFRQSDYRLFEYKT